MSELEIAETAARTEAATAVLASMEAPQLVPTERPEKEDGRGWMLKLDRDIAGAVSRARDAEARWSSGELARFRNPTERLRECAAAVLKVARRLKQAAAFGVFGLAVLSGPSLNNETEMQPSAQERVESRPAAQFQAPQLNIELSLGLLGELPPPGVTRISNWPDGELYLTRTEGGDSVLDELDVVWRQTAQAMEETVSSLPPGITELMEQEAAASPGTPELNFRALVMRLDDLRTKGDPRADQLMDIMSSHTDKLDKIREEHEDALDPLMEALGPAQALVEAGQKPELGLDSPEGKKALAVFTEAMERIGVKVEYKSGWE